MQLPKKISEEVIYKNKWRTISVKRFQEKDRIWEFPVHSHTETKFALVVFPISKNWDVYYNKEWRVGPEDFVYNFPMVHILCSIYILRLDIF